MRKITLQVTESEFETIEEMIRETEPDMTADKYIYLMVLRQMKLFLSGKAAGIEAMQKAYHEARTEVR
jgi:hypothetical protein